MRGGTIKNLVVEGKVTSTNSHAGGIVGKMAFGTIENCSFHGSVTTTTSNKNGYAGGIVAYEGFSGSATSTSSVSGCSNYGTVTGNYAGGITGYAKYGTISDCYNNGTITGGTVSSPRAGGLAGQAQNNVVISNSYNIGSVSGGSAPADIVDFLYSSAKLTNCYYRNGEKANGTGTGTVSGGGVIDDSLLTNLGPAFAADTNNINGGYPILAWEAGSAPQPKDPKIKIAGNAPLYMTNSGAQPTAELSVNYIDMDDTPAVNWSIASGEDVISIAEGDTAGTIKVTPLKAGKAKVKAVTEDEAYSDEAEILVYPFITGLSMKETPIKGETYSVEVSVMGGKSYDYDNYPPLNNFEWKYYDASTGNAGETAIQGKEHEITIPDAAAGKYLAVSIWYNGSNITASPRKEVLAGRVPVIGVTIEGATDVAGELTAEAGATLKAVAEGL